MAGRPREVLLAAVIGAQGLKGEVRVKTFTAKPNTVGAYGPLHTRDGRIFTVIAVNALKDGEAVLSLSDVSNRDGAQALKGVELFVYRDALPATQGNEFYHTDLVGLRAEDIEDRVLGTVKSIHNYGAGDVLEIEQPGGNSILLVFTRETVPRIEIDKGRIVVAVPHETEAQKHNYTE